MHIISNVETKLQMSFAASVLKGVKNFLPKYFSTIWLLFLWETGFSNLHGNLLLENQRFPPFSYNRTIFRYE